MNLKMEQELNFVIDNNSRLFLDAQKAKTLNSGRSPADSFRFTPGSYPAIKINYCYGEG